MLKNPSKVGEKEFAKADPMEEVPETEMHGVLGVGHGWKPPAVVTFCDKIARPGYADNVKAHEYADHPEVLWEKVGVLADLIRQSKHFLTYTGAGISTKASIADYASKSDKSKATGGKKTAVKPFEAKPTFAHFVLTALQRGGYLKHWIQQNHDGLPQKAGFPQSHINEIHGAWFDPSNPVVPMSGSLRGDLCSWMEKEEEKTDLVLAMGTSLCGMNADRMVQTPGEKFLQEGIGLGSVIVGFQRTKLDHVTSLRIFADIDETMVLLAHRLSLPVPTEMYVLKVPEAGKTDQPHQFLVPYRPGGKRSKSHHIIWDLSPGAKVRLVAGPGKGFEGVIRQVPKHEHDHYWVTFPCTREGPTLGFGTSMYCLGSWWVEEACSGRAPFLPFVNIPEGEEKKDY